MAKTPDSRPEQLIAFEQACKDAGLRLTHQRLEIFRELAAASDHPSAETLHQRLRKSIPTLSLDTVYRTLATFAEYGLIGKIDTVESQARFEATGCRHHHLICRKCGSIADFQWPSIDTAPLPEEIGAWGRIDIKNVVAHGVCKKCLEPRGKR